MTNNCHRIRLSIQGLIEAIESFEYQTSFLFLFHRYLTSLISSLIIIYLVLHCLLNSNFYIESKSPGLDKARFPERMVPKIKAAPSKFHGPIRPDLDPKSITQEEF